MTTSTAATHSMGPWTIQRHRRDDGVERQISSAPPGRGPVVATVKSLAYVHGKHPDDDPVADANARLIAAAPSLLAAAEAVVKSLNGDPAQSSEPVRELMEAIEKARG